MTLKDARLFEALADAAPDALLVVDAAGRIRYANQATLAMFGHSQAELIAAPIESLIPTRFRRRHRRERRRYAGNPMSRPMGLNIQLVGRRRDGSEVPVEVSLSPLTVDGERLVVAAVRDVTELRRSRELLKRGQRQQALAQLAEQAVSVVGTDAFCAAMLGVLIEQLRLSRAGVCERGHEGRHTRFVALHGWTEAEALTVIESLLSPGRRQRLFGGEVQQLRVAPGRVGRRTPAAHLGGTLMPLRGPSKVHGVLALFRRADEPLSLDECLFAQSACHLAAAVFERQHHQSLLLQASKMEALGQLTGGVAHDFNNLLTVIAGNLQILEDVLNDRADARLLVDSAARAARRGAELTAKLLAFSRKRPLAAQAVDCAQLLGGMRDLLRRTLGEGIELRYRIEPGLRPALADAGQLESAVLNLALNARDAMPRGGTLTLSAQQHDSLRPGSHGEGVVIEISDSGEGMSREVLARALEPFFTTKAAGKGTGLGLSMVYGFVRQWGGDVRIDSEPGCGTTVRLLLPPAPGQDARKGAQATPRLIGGSEHLLVVEDDPEVAAIAQAQLRSLGYRVSQAASIDTAMAALAAQPDIVLVFTDVVLLGGETGFQLADRVRHARPGMPVLYCSGYAETALEDHFGTGERPRILAKPYTREEVGAAIQAMLELTRV
ncbi:MAG: PAS domain S-box protein [Xanthomonadales bacterium]|nr:Sensor histidine kinase RcsC [Xanthomonadales bacterium]MCC6594644.1 PAS domain S-box protein [Xanthomonadales bacterium]MCE7932261.1 PAS domain S-box protein [Xanthomonadales bacterium PRO6]